MRGLWEEEGEEGTGCFCFRDGGIESGDESPEKLRRLLWGGLKIFAFGFGFRLIPVRNNWRIGFWVVY